jgi:hypothetical protein
MNGENYAYEIESEAQKVLNFPKASCGDGIIRYTKCIGDYVPRAFLLFIIFEIKCTR